MPDGARSPPPHAPPPHAPPPQHRRTGSATPFADDRLHVPFRSTSLVSLAEFAEFIRENQPLLDARYLHERTLGSAEESISLDGSCAPCLRRARFSARTQGDDILPDGRLVPNWREELHCDCEDRLNNRSRALLHFLQTVAGLRSWSRVLLFGPASPADPRIAARSQVASLPRLGLARGAAAIGSTSVTPLPPCGHHRLPAPRAATGGGARRIPPGAGAGRTAGLHRPVPLPGAAIGGAPIGCGAAPAACRARPAATAMRWAGTSSTCCAPPASAGPRPRLLVRGARLPRAGNMIFSAVACAARGHARLQHK